MFGTFNSQVKLKDAILRRIIHDVIRQAEAGATTNKMDELYEQGVFLSMRVWEFHTGNFNFCQEILIKSKMPTVK